MRLLRNYTLVHRSATGTYKHLINDAYSVRWVLRLNKPGTLTLELPSAFCSSVAAGYGISDFDADDQFLLYRSLGAGLTHTLVGEAPFHLAKAEVRRRDDGKRVVYIEAELPLGFLGRRINAYSSERNASDFENNVRSCDDLAKYMVRNNFSPTAESYAAAPDPLRNLSTYLQIQGDVGAIAPATPYTGSAENAGVLSEIQKIADYAASQGIPMFFDVVMVSENPYLLEFRTYAQQRGIDRTQTTGGANAFVVVDNVNVADYTLTFDWSNDYVNRVYVGSSNGSGNTKTYETVTDPNLAALLAVSPFALREDYVSSNSDNSGEMQAEGNVELQGRRAIFQANGLLADNLISQYGQAFGFGDKVTVFLEGLSFDAFIDSESGTLEERGEKLEVGFNTESTLKKSSGTVGTIISGMGSLRKQINYLRRKEIP